MLMAPSSHRHTWVVIRARHWSRLAWLMAAWLIIGLCSGPCVHASPPEGWEVMRVFIQDDPEQISRLVTSHYATVLLDDLARKLVEQNNRRKVSPLRTAALEEAVYMARLEGHMIVSDQSRWKLVGPAQVGPAPGQNVELGTLTLALRTARGIPPSDLQLSDHAQFSPTGTLELPLVTDVSTYWFGFSLNSREQESARVFDFHLPPAIGAKLLLSAPSNVELSSPTVVAQKLSSLVEHLPASWPTTAFPSPTGAVQWWLVHLSGASRFQLYVKQESVANLTRYKRLVRSAAIDYVGSHQHLETHARFRLVGYQPDTPLRMQLSNQLKLETVLVDGTPVRWRVTPSLAGESNLIELIDLKASSQDLDIELRALCPIVTSDAVVLPQIVVDEAYAMDGKSRLWGRDGLVANMLTQSTGKAQRVLRVVGDGKLASGPVDDPLVWQASWVGTPPAMEASFSRQRQTAVARSLTRFSIQADWLAATCRLRVDAPHLTSNEMRFPVGKGWFIDSVRLIDAEPDIRPRMEDRVSATSPMIVIDWEGKRQQLSLELEVRAHSPRDVNSDTISLRSPRLVSLPQSDQIDNYVIEPSSRFAVRMDAQLLPYQRLRFDLPVWQQELLPSTSEMWLFQGVRGSIPPITLVAGSGTYSSQQLTVVTREVGPSALKPSILTPSAPDTVVVTTHIHCRPTSGSIDRVALTLPAGHPASSWQWMLGQPGENEESVTLPASTDNPSRSAESSGVQHTTRLDLELPGPLSTPFTLTGQVRIQLLAAEADLTIPVVAVLATAQSESTLLVPRDLAAGLEQVTAELLSSADQPLREAMSVRDIDLNSFPAHTWVAARLEAGASQKLKLKRSVPLRTTGWIWSEALRHTLWDDGHVTHDARWIIEGTRLTPLQIQLPKGWQIEEIAIDDVPSEHPGQVQLVQVELPEQNRITVSLRCASSQPPPKWLSHDRWARPTLSLPILASQTSLVIPPSRLAVRQLPNQWSAGNSPLRLVDRLLPMALWSRLGPTPVPKNNLLLANPMGWSSLPAGWSMLELNSGTAAAPPPALGGASEAAVDARQSQALWSGGEWIISRSALSALALAFVLCVAAVSWFSLGSHPRHWWLAITISLILVVLVPNWLLAPAQLVLLAVVLATLLRLCTVVYAWRRSAFQVRGRSSIVHTTGSVSTTAVMILGCWGGSTMGQSTNSLQNIPAVNSSDISFENNSTNPSSKTRPEIFSVLIPIDEAGTVAGAYAYAPTRLLELLAGGNESATRMTPPKILSADYTLRMRRGLVGAPDQIQELSVEFRLQVTQPDIEIRLPFNVNQLQLQRGSVAGQELFVGGRWLYQVPEAVVYRPSMAGTVRLQLQFEPRDLAVTATQANLRCSIPPIPTASLRIVADSSSTFEIRSSGTGRKTISSVSTELLGPTSELNVQWSPGAQRTTPGQVTAEVLADTWLHARGNQVSAICQIRIASTRALPQELHVVSEPGWEPVGTFWEDGDLIASEQSALGGRQVYKIRCKEDWNQTAPLILRVPMVPRDESNLENLAVPFFTLREASQQAVTRTLAWSAEEHALWKPDGLDLWQELANVPGLEWGDLAWEQRPQLYRVVGTLATALRTAAIAPQATIDEMTRVHLGQGEIRLNYRGQFSSLQARPLALLVPAGSRVEQVLVDGVAVGYRLSERREGGLLELLPGAKPMPARVVELSLSQALSLGRPTRFPRVSMLEYSASRSLYRVQCGTGLECQVLSDGALELAPASIPSHELLPALETLVGQVDLRDGFRDVPRLPLQFVVEPRLEPRLIGAVMALQPAGQGWKAIVSATWDAQHAPLDFAFFELPLSIRDSVDTGQLPAQLSPLGGSGRMTLRMLPPAPVDGKTRVEFSFSLPGNSTNPSLSIPSVSIVTANPSQPVLALPAQIEGQAVRWTPAGRRIDELPTDLRDPRWDLQHHWYQLESGQTQVSWRRLETKTQNTEMLLTHVTLLNQQEDQIAGFIDYWLVPHGQLDLLLSLPESCHVLGVEIGAQPAIWSQTGAELRVLLQPNYLPLNVRVLLHWQVPSTDTLALRLPRMLNADGSARSLEFVENRLTQYETNVSADNSIQYGILRGLTERWARILIDSYSTGRARADGELAAWIESWHPQHVGLDGKTPIDSQEQTDLSRLLDAEDSEEWVVTTAEELWQRMWLLARRTEKSLLSEEVSDNALALMGLPPAIPFPASVIAPPRYARLSSEQDTLVLARIPSTSIWTPQWLAAGFLASASLLSLFLARRLGRGYAKLVAAQPWLYWLQLAVLAWCLLPVMWPSWILLASAIGMLISQWFDTRRRQRLLARV